MGVVDVDPLAVLPITAASASAAFARAADPVRDLNEREEHCRSLGSLLASVRRQLDRCDQVLERLATELDAARSGRTCPVESAVCRQCLGAPVSDSAGDGRCPRCEQAVQPDQGRSSCGQPSTVVLQDVTGTEQALCLPHALTSVRRTPRLRIVTASRPDRAVLGEAAAASSVISGHVAPRVNARSGPPGG